VKWSVSNSKIKIVKQTNQYVKIKAVKNGSATLKAKVGKKTYACKITVKAKKKLTPEQAERKLYKWLVANNKDVKGAYLRYEGIQDGCYFFKYCSDMGTHESAINWYYVNPKTGKITAMF
jgi:hypothetical protein